MTEHKPRAWRNALAVLAALVVGWQILHAVVGEVALRSPWETVAYTAKLFASRDFWPNFDETMTAFAAALAIAVATGLAIGMLLGFSRLAGEVFEPVLVALYSIPKVTLYPIVLLAFGLGMQAKIAFGAIHGIIPIALFTINAVRNVRPILIKTGRVMKLTTWEMVWQVLFPAAIPEIFTGLRIGFSLTLIGTLLGEMFASQRGLGYMLMNGIGLHNVDVIMSVTFMLVVFAAVISSALLAIDRVLHGRA
ncbi:MAG: ABC transporter permease subunit [Alphaproteobacteria bacterium]|nr:ABC transporter permease subunit [Alphaproteobacteria bacterium]